MIFQISLNYLREKEPSKKYILNNHLRNLCEATVCPAFHLIAYVSILYCAVRLQSVF